MTEEPVSYEIDRKLFCEFVRGMSARNRLVEDLVDNRIGPLLRRGQDLTDEQLAQLQEASRILQHDEDELADLLDVLNGWSLKLLRSENRAKELRREHALEAYSPTMQWGGM